MTDIDIKALLKQLMRRWQRRVLASLLAGNDSGCFSTAQYAAAWVRLVDKGGKSLMDEKEARCHLRHLSGVREVRPDVRAEK